MVGNNEPLASPVTPKISVIIPLYNHEKYIKEAVNSVLNQSFDDFELIIINDGSTDNSGEVIKKIQDKRIHYYYQENQGAHATLNRGIGLAQGTYISILNSDDMYYSTRFEKMVRILEHDSSVHAVFSHIEFIDGNGNSIRFKRGAEDNWLGRNPETSYKGNNHVILDLLAGNFLYTTSNLFCRKSVFDDIGYFSNLKYIHDYEFFLRLCYHYKVHIIEEPLLKYRFHESNTLNENYAIANFETGLVLSNFLITYDLENIFSNKDQASLALAKFFNSLNTYDTDKMIMTLLLFSLKYRKEIADNLLEIYTDNGDNPFRIACIDVLKKTRALSLSKQALTWQEGQTELWWRTSEKLKNETISLNNEIRLRDEKIRLRDEKIRRAEEDLDSLLEKEIQLHLIINSDRWKLLMKMSNMIEKILPLESKRRIFIQNCAKKIFKL
jgi:glycosyltransferase involved in cell wall biosynthesis